MPRVLIVVPTLGQRLDYLGMCLESITSQGVDVDIALVAPITPELTALAQRFNASLTSDPGSLTKAINAGVKERLNHHEFVNWLGDDDLLTPGSLKLTIAALDNQPEAVVSYGACRYIDGDGNELWISKAGPWASRILGWGPDLIPQPGMLVRSDAWRAVSGVDESYRFAFDLDLLLKLKKIGTLVDVGEVVSCFRWHADSLTVGDRSTNIAESERAKRASLGPVARKLCWIWEAPVRVATRFAANEVSRRARKLQEVREKAEA
jgi:hypothetical protein